MNSGIKTSINRYGIAAHLDSHSPFPLQKYQRNYRMVYFKACTECQGYLSLEKDSYGPFLKCLQCGKPVEVEETKDKRSVLHGSISNEAAIHSLVTTQVETAIAA